MNTNQNGYRSTENFWKLLFDPKKQYFEHILQSYLIRSKLEILDEKSFFNHLNSGYILGEVVNYVLKILSNSVLDNNIDIYFSSIRQVLLKNFELIQLSLSDVLVHFLRNICQSKVVNEAELKPKKLDRIEEQVQDAQEEIKSQVKGVKSKEQYPVPNLLMQVIETYTKALEMLYIVPQNT